MKDLGKWAFDNRKLVYFLIGVLMLGGTYFSYRMSKLEDPEVKVKLAMVVTTYPGASAHQVELEVTDVLETGIRRMGDIDNVESYSYNDLSLIQVELKTTVPDARVEQCWDQLRRKVADVQPSLPAGCGVSMVKEDFSNVYGIFYALTGDGQSVSELGDYADLLMRELGDISGVERVEVYGREQECINICLLQDKMAGLGVKPAEVLATLNGQNKTVYAGYFDNGDARVRIAVTDRFRAVEDIRRMLIQGHEDDQLRLDDIALVEADAEQPVRNAMSYDGRRALGLLIAPSPDADVIKVGAAVEKRLDELKQHRLPTGVEVHKVFFQPERVEDALGTFIINLIESVAIVVLILMLTMGFRSGIIIGVSLVVIVFGSFLFLGATGGTMQRVSLGAFILAMGMLVDNAIVIVDGILVALKRGESRAEALTSIGRRTAMPLLGATLIAILSFLPIFLSPDTAGVYTHDLFVVLAVSLLLSWVLALTHVPLMANRYLKQPELTPATVGGTSQEAVLYQGRIYALLRTVIRFGLRHRWGFVLTMVALVVLAALGYPHMRHGFFPDMQYDQLYMEYKLPEGTNSTRVAKDLARIEDYLRTRPEVKHVTASIGGAPGRYNLVRTVPLPSLSYGELIIDFESPEALVDNMDEIQAHLEREFPDAYLKLKRYNLMFKKYPIEVQFSGPDPAVLHALSDSARRIMEECPEVRLITTNWEPPVPVLTVDYDQATARALGLSRSDVSLSILSAAGGIPVGSFHEGTHRRTLYLKTTAEDGTQIEEPDNVQVFSTLPSLGGLLNEDALQQLRTGKLSREQLVEALMGTTPLRQVARSVDVRWEDPVVPRYNGRRMQRVQCSPVSGVETEKARTALAEKLQHLQLPDGYSLSWQGEKHANDQSMQYLFLNFPLAIILMLAILIMLFRDYRKPAIIFACIPLVFVGVVLTMLLTGKTFTFVAIVGALGLIGMLVKNGIVLMDEITLQLQEGVEPATALIVSAQSRLRPVMMASLTTILGMIPLLSDAMFGSLAVTIMGGLLFGTLVTLVFIPILYALFFHIKADKK